MLKKVREVSNLKAKAKVDKIQLSWSLETEDVNHIEIFAKYFNDKHFWRVDGYPKTVRAVELDADALAPITYKVHIVFNDNSWSNGKTVEETALHTNVVQENFEGRKILIYLPDGYHEENVNYPVIYMHDGQNLFSKRLSYIDEWYVDEAMDRLIRNEKMQKAVVVGIYNSAKRAEEYTPFADRRYGGGKAREFSAYIVEKIIPYIESKYKISQKREDRAVMGSSFGGILSLWMGYTYPEVFSMVGAISPSLWIADGAMLRHLEVTPKRDVKIWIDQGTGEYSDFTRNAVDILLSKGYKYGQDLLYYEVKDANHNELAWAERVECPFLLFKGKPAEQIIGLNLQVQMVRQFAAGSFKTVVNPVAHFDNGIWYSLYTNAKYSVTGKSKAEVDQTGVVKFNDTRSATIKVKYEKMERNVTVYNPEPQKTYKSHKKSISLKSPTI